MSKFKLLQSVRLQLTTIKYSFINVDKLKPGDVPVLARLGWVALVLMKIDHYAADIQCIHEAMTHYKNGTEPEVDYEADGSEIKYSPHETIAWFFENTNVPLLPLDQYIREAIDDYCKIDEVMTEGFMKFIGDKIPTYKRVGDTMIEMTAEEKAASTVNRTATNIELSTHAETWDEDMKAILEIAKSGGDLSRIEKYL